MESSPYVLYVTADELAARRFGQALAGASPRSRWSWTRPESLIDRHALDCCTAMLIDSPSLGAAVVEVLQRVRWLGFDRLVLLCGFSGSELDRVLAISAGANAVEGDALPLTRLVGWCGIAGQPALDANGPSVRLTHPRDRRSGAAMATPASVAG